MMVEDLDMMKVKRVVVKSPFQGKVIDSNIEGREE